MAYLALIRHGKSQWNEKGLWTGLTDIPLSKDGEKEAQKSGEQLQSIHFDYGYSPPLKRAKDTLAIILKTTNQSSIPVTITPALNERDYGDLTGKNKWDIKKEYGEEQFLKWRRGWNVPIPNGETLKDVYNRVAPYYDEVILQQLKQGKNVILASSGNTVRALVKHLENISEDEIPHLEISTGEIYLYKIDASGNILSKEKRASHPNTV